VYEVEVSKWEMRIPRTPRFLTIIIIISIFYYVGVCILQVVNCFVYMLFDELALMVKENG